MDEQQLWDKAIEEARNRWTWGVLESFDSQRHCALGCVGYARWGTRTGHPRWGYDELLSDEATHKMITKMAAVIREQYPVEFPSGFCDDTDAVMIFNDRYRDADSVAEVMEKARNL